LFTTRCWRCSKNRKNALRISLLVMSHSFLESPQLAQGALQSKRDFPTTVRALTHQDSQEIPLLLVRLFGTYLPTQVELTVHQERSPSHRTTRLNLEVFPLAGERHIACLPGGCFEFTLQAMPGELVWSLQAPARRRGQG